VRDRAKEGEKEVENVGDLAIAAVADNHKEEEEEEEKKEEDSDGKIERER